MKQNISISPLKWKDDVLYVGKIKVGSVHYSSFISREDPKKYQATCFLPGIKSDLGRFETKDAAKTQVETGVNRFLKLLSIED